MFRRCQALGVLLTLMAVRPAASQPPQPDQAPPEYPAILRATFQGHTDRIRCVAVGFEGKTVASGGSDNTVRLWDTATGEQRRLLQHTAAVTCLAFSADGQKLASGDTAGLVHLWDVNAGEKLATLEGIEGTVLQVAVAGDAKTVGAVGADMGVLWDVETGKTRLPFKGRRLAFSSDGTRLAVGRTKGSIAYWDLVSGDPIGTAAGHRDGFQALTFSPNGKIVASAALTGGINGTGQDKSIKLWDVPFGTMLAQLDGHRKGPYSLTFAPNGKFLLATDFNGSMKLWDLEEKRVIATLEKVRKGERLTGTPIGSWAISPDLTGWAVGADNEVMWLDISDFTKAAHELGTVAPATAPQRETAD